MNPFKQGCVILSCFASSCILWIVVAFIGQLLVLGLTPKDTNFFPLATALTYSSYVIGAGFICIVVFAVYHYRRKDRREARYSPLSYELGPV